MVSVSVAAFAEPIDFTLVNHTDSDVTDIYIAAISDEEWGDDILGGDPPLYRGSMEISFGSEYEALIKKENIKLFDMLCVVDGEEVVFENLENKIAQPRNNRAREGSAAIDGRRSCANAYPVR